MGPGGSMGTSRVQLSGFKRHFFQGKLVIAQGLLTVSEVGQGTPQDHGNIHLNLHVHVHCTCR